MKANKQEEDSTVMEEEPEQTEQIVTEVAAATEHREIIPSTSDFEKTTAASEYLLAKVNLRYGPFTIG